MTCAYRCFFVLPVLLLAVACQPESSEPGPGNPGVVAERPAKDALDRETAIRRKARIDDLRYDLFVDVASDPDEYRGEVSISFELVDASTPLTVDFGGGAVDAVSVNGIAVDAGYNGYFITIPAAALEVGPTRLRIAYSHPFSSDGNGLHRFEDPADGLAYLYTYLWPYYGNRLLPAFDQPDLKAPFTLRVLAPDNWIVVSAAPGISAPVENGTSLWTFATTPTIATYMFSLHAGPYHVWESEARDVPLRLLARQSLAEYVPVDEWFDITRRGMAFYSDFFDIPYPFEKYDQVIAPEATIGGMENVAAVTYGERYIQRQASDRRQREDRANVILHETAHMWFGDLVTYEWWNGMWLTESFATLMAKISTGEVTEFTDIWHGFLINSKRRAYARDSRVTTHPIEMPIRSTDEFHLVWDDITYQKGASVLKQLRHFVGDDNFRDGVSSYLKDNSWGNTTLAEFIEHQEQGAGISLEEWTDDWLLATGFNTLGVELACNDERIDTLAITQKAPSEHPTLRTHRIDVALIGDDGDGALAVNNVYPVTVDGSRSVVEDAEGAPCPILVNPNHDDWTFAKLALGDSDVDILRTRLDDIADPMVRSIFLAALYDRAMSGAMPIAEYATLVLRLADSESNLRVLEQITATLNASVDLMQRLRPQTDTALSTLLPRIEDASLRLARSATTQDVKLMWVNLFLAIVDTPGGIDTLRAILGGEESVDGIELSPELRWKMLIILSRHGVEGIDELLTAVRANDSSDFARKQLLSAQAAGPGEKNKAEWLAELQSPIAVTGLAAQRAVMAELFPPTQTDLQLLLLDDILSALPALTRDRDFYFLSNYTQLLLKPMCTGESVARMQSALDDYGDQLDPTVLRFLREAHQADGECLVLRNAQ